MKKKKILFTTPNFNTAGSGKVVLDLIRGLKNDFDIEVACFNNKGALFEIVQAEGIKIHIFNFTEPGKPYLSLLSRIKRIVIFFKKNQFDLIHSWHYLDDWTEPLAARLAGVPFVFTKKSMSWRGKDWKLRSFFASKIITINTDMNREFYPNKSKAVYIPLGLDINEYKPQVRELSIYADSGLQESNFVMLSVANLVPIKGIETAIESLHMCQDANVHYVIVGGYEQKYYEKLLELVATYKLENNVHFLGKKTDVRPYVAACDLFLIPTLNEGRKEGQPMAPIEAMSSGRIVVGSRIPGVTDILVDFPELIFNAKNATQLSLIIEDVKRLNKEDKDNLEKKMRATVLKKYQTKDFVEANAKIYNQLFG